MTKNDNEWGEKWTNAFSETVFRSAEAERQGRAAGESYFGGYGGPSFGDIQDSQTRNAVENTFRGDYDSARTRAASRGATPEGYSGGLDGGYGPAPSGSGIGLYDLLWGLGIVVVLVGVLASHLHDRRLEQERAARATSVPEVAVAPISTRSPERSVPNERPRVTPTQRRVKRVRPTPARVRATPVRPTPVPSYRVVNVKPGGFLNIREGPGTNYGIVGGIPANSSNVVMIGNEVRVDDGAWALVSYGGTRGWVNRRYLNR